MLHVPRQGWLLGCSLLLAAMGLGLMRLASSETPGRSAWAWAFTLLLLVAAVAVSAAWPLLDRQNKPNARQRRTARTNMLETLSADGSADESRSSCPTNPPPACLALSAHAGWGTANRPWGNAE